MLLTALALAALIRGRLDLGSGSLALAVLAKVYALASVPGDRGITSYAVVVSRRFAVQAWSSRRRRGRALAVCASRPRRRRIQPLRAGDPPGRVESLSASALLVADRIGLYHAHTIVGGPELDRPRRRRSDRRRDLLSCVALSGLSSRRPCGTGEEKRPASGSYSALQRRLVGYVTFGKVLSTQYIVWLLPVVPLVRGWVGHAATVVLAAATWLTKLEYSHLDALSRGTGLGLLVARNLVLVSLYVLLAVALRRRTVRGDAGGRSKWQLRTDARPSLPSSFN